MELYSWNFYGDPVQTNANYQNIVHRPFSNHKGGSNAKQWKIRRNNSHNPDIHCLSPYFPHFPVKCGGGEWCISGVLTIYFRSNFSLFHIQTSFIIAKWGRGRHYFQLTVFFSTRVPIKIYIWKLSRNPLNLLKYYILPNLQTSAIGNTSFCLFHP